MDEKEIETTRWRIRKLFAIAGEHSRLTPSEITDVLEIKSELVRAAIDDMYAHDEIEFVSLGGAGFQILKRPIVQYA